MLRESNEQSHFITFRVPDKSDYQENIIILKSGITTVMCPLRSNI